MRVHIKYFASIREAVGQGAETLETSAATVGALRDELLAKGGTHGEALARTRAIRMALNQVMADEEATLPDGAEVAFFPPVTGG